MIARIVRQALDIISHSPNCRPYIPQLVLSHEIVSNPHEFDGDKHLNSQKLSTLERLFGDDGILWATPKHRTPIHKIWRRRYGDDNWKFGTKLWKPKRNIVSCLECGEFHEVHTICRACFAKVNKESQAIIESIRKMWTAKPVDRAVQVVYKGETPSSLEKRVVELDRPRPLWFTPNLSQKAANVGRKLAGPLGAQVDDTIRIIKSPDSS